MTTVLEQGRVITELRYFKVVEINQTTKPVYLICQTWNNQVVDAIHDKVEAVSYASTENERLTDNPDSDEL